jgi:hypothetical protein
MLPDMRRCRVRCRKCRRTVRRIMPQLAASARRDSGVVTQHAHCIDVPEVPETIMPLSYDFSLLGPEMKILGIGDPWAATGMWRSGKMCLGCRQATEPGSRIEYHTWMRHTILTCTLFWPTMVFSAIGIGCIDVVPITFPQSQGNSPKNPE